MDSIAFHSEVGFWLALLAVLASALAFIDLRARSRVAP